MPLLTIGHDVILGESCPETGGVVRITEGVDIFLHALQHFFFRIFL